jgi:molybdate transport system ATP-binding protein
MSFSISLFHQFSTLHGVQKIEANLNLDRGDFVSISGISGSGKTTFLKILSGLIQPVNGDIIFGDQRWLDTQRGFLLSPQKRKIGMVFQDYALFPNMNVLDNIKFAAGSELEESYLHDIIDALGLAHLLTRFTYQLSGGQQQRVAIARAIISKPQLLLMDEPFSALDEALKKSVQSFIYELHQKYFFTTLIVNHQISDIKAFSNKFLKFEEDKLVAYQPKMEYDFTVEGIILSKESSDLEICHVTVSYNGNTYQIPLPAKEAGKLNIGDTLKFGSYSR